VTDLDVRDIQGNILRGYRLPSVAHVFGRCQANDVDGWKRFLSSVSEHLTIAQWGKKPETTLNLGLSQRAIAGLAPDLDFELKRQFPAFAQGMWARTRELGDGPAFDQRWRDRDVWIAIHGANRESVQAALTALKSQAGRLPLAEVPPFGQAIVKDDAWYEHFGFRDDISYPAVDGTPDLSTPDIVGRGVFDANTQQWRTIATGEFLLGFTNESGEDVLDGLSARARVVLRNATFGVVRRLKQNVVEFRRYVEEHGDNLGNDYVASRMMGRTPRGDSLARPGQMLDFTYADDDGGAHCPLGAHIRRANPRVDGRHRLIRRGMTFGVELPVGQKDDTERGLWFVAFNASIEDQFEFIQNQWINGPIGRGVGDSGEPRDPIVGSGAPRAFVIDGDQATQRAPRLLLNLPDFVVCQGGQYYLVPGRAGLRELCSL
jgi:Dyp-type peroxidase family